MEVICLCQLLLGMGLPWMGVDIPTDTPLEKTDFFPSNHISITNSFLVRGGDVFP